MTGVKGNSSLGNIQETWAFISKDNPKAAKDNKDQREAHAER